MHAEKHELEGPAQIRHMRADPSRLCAGNGERFGILGWRRGRPRGYLKANYMSKLRDAAATSTKQKDEKKCGESQLSDGKKEKATYWDCETK